MSAPTFATAVSCIDGRVQEPLLEWVRLHFGVAYVDVVTEPGADRVMAEGDDAAYASVLHKVDVSHQSHGSRVLVLAGHHDCAANPGSPEQHERQLEAAVARLAGDRPDMTIFGVFVDSSWQVRPACLSARRT